MKTFAAICLVLTVVCALFLAGAHGQEDMTAIDNRVFPNAQRPASVFHHDDHNEKALIDECNQCHHVYEDGKKLEDESSEDMRCSDCHGPESKADEPTLRRAFHGNCMGCHLEQGKGPILCGECHVKS